MLLDGEWRLDRLVVEWYTLEVPSWWSYQFGQRLDALAFVEFEFLEFGI